MKKALSLVLSLLLAIAPMTIASAAVTDVSVESNLYEITVSVTASSAGRATIKVFPYQSDFSSSIDYTKPIYIGEKALDGENKCTFKFNFLDTPDPTGYYCAIVNNEITEGGKFKFISPATKFDFYKALVNSDANGVKTAIDTYEATAVDFSLGKYKTNYSDVGALINKQLITINTDALKTNFNAASTLEEKLACVSSYENNFKTKFAELLNLADIVLAGNATTFDTLLKANATALGLTTTYYNTTYFTDPAAAIYAKKFVPASFAAAADTTEVTVKDMFNIALLLAAVDSSSAGTVTKLLEQCETEGSLALYKDASNPLTNEEKTELSIDLQAEENLTHTNILSTYERLYKAIIAGRTGSEGDDDEDGGFTPAPDPTPPGGGIGGGGPIMPDEEKDPDGETPAGTDGELSDINDAPWAEEAINSLVEKGVLSGRGDGKFYPNDTVTREEFVKIIVEAFEISKDHDGAEFSDVDNDRWSYEYIAAALKAGIVSGDSESTFNPTGRMSRQDMAVIIYRTAKALGFELPEEGAAFDDHDNVSDYAKDAVSVLAAAGIVNGTGENKFSPKDIVTRAQAAKIVYESLKAMGGTK